MINSLFSFIPVLNPAVSVGGFAGRGYGYSGGVSYFSSENRNTIISAGKSQKIVELLYDGFRRYVEPYELEYRVRKSDDMGVEYFWGYDMSGGKSGKIGTKMFICDKIQSITETNMPFYPRFPIQL